MNRPTMLLCALIEEILSQHKLPANRDVETVQHRVENEGDSFLTITLPELGATLEAALESGLLTREMCPSFGHNKRGKLPRFLQGLFRKIFSEDGVLREDADPDAIYGIRQICYWNKKPKAVSNSRRVKATIDKYLRVEEDLARFTDICVNIKYDTLFRRVSDLIWGEAFQGFNPDDIVCFHGPGATAERLMNNEREAIKQWPNRSEEFFPSALHAIPNFSHWNELEGIQFIDEDQEPPVRVITVPKTMKNPRIIAVEPSHMQYMQQGMMRFIVQSIERCPLTRKSVRFAEQTVNQENARRASITKNFATLDLSDASDRVHNELIKSIFFGHEIGAYLQASRSLRASVPGVKTPISLLKFASMGSATCFPVEAMAFYTLIQYSLHKHHDISPSVDTIKNYSDRIDVYGDDIIVPVYIAGIVVETLEAFGLMVNRRKSFINGNFRESCGGDYFKGTDVTPVYLRHVIPSNFNDRCDAQMLKSLASTSDWLYLKGLWKTCQLLRDWVQQLARKRIPRSRFAGSGIFFLSRLFCTGLRWDKNHQGLVQNRLVLVPTKRHDPCTSLGGLNKLLRGKVTNEIDSHIVNTTHSEQQLDLSSSVKRGVLKLKRRWIPALMGLEVTL